jgi:hypothetical protein
MFFGSAKYAFSLDVVGIASNHNPYLQCQNSVVPVQDLAICQHGANVTPDQYLNTVPFMDEIVKRLDSRKSRM